MKKQLLSLIMNKTGMRFLLSKLQSWSGLVVLNYHRIGHGSTSFFDRGLWSATQDAFDYQIRYCKSHFDIIAPEDLTELRHRRNGRYVLITFDDGYKDNYEVAFPVLMTHGVKAIFFVATGFIDDPKLPWWDEIAWMVRTSRKKNVELPAWLPASVRFDDPNRERAVRSLLRVFKTLPSNITDSYLSALGDATGSGRCGRSEGVSLWMTWDMLREMRGAGMSIGGHTVTHPILAQMTQEQQWYEISNCGQRLAEEVGRSMRFFSYPVGGLHTFNADTQECLQKAGVEFAFSYYGGFQVFSKWNPYDIQRIPVEEYITPDWFQTIVSLPGIFAHPRI